MSSQRMENLGRLQVAKQEAIRLSIRIHQLRGEINQQTNQHRPIAELNTRALSVALDELHAATLRHRELCDEMKQLCDDLGEPMPNVDVRR